MLDFALDVAPGDQISGGVLTFSDATQQVTGALRDRVEGPRRITHDLAYRRRQAILGAGGTALRTTRPGTNGRFTVTGLPVGKRGWRPS